MKIEITQKLLHDLLTGVRGGVSSRDIEPAFKNFYVIAEQGILKVRATDGSILEESKLTKEEAEAKEQRFEIENSGNFLIDAEEFTALVSSFPAESKIVLEKSDVIKFRCEKFASDFQIRENEGNEIILFPDPNDYELGENKCQLKMDFLEAFRRVAFATANVETQVRTYDLSGVCIQFRPKQENEIIDVCLQATDSNRISSLSGDLKVEERTYKNLFSNERKSAKIYIYDRLVSEAARIGAHAIEFNSDLTKIKIHSDKVTLSTMHNEFSFPDLTPTIDKNKLPGIMNIKVGKQKYAQVINRACLLADDVEELRSIKTKVDSQAATEKTLEITGRSQRVSSFKDLLEVIDITGDPFEITFSIQPDYIKDFMSSLKGDFVNIRLSRNEQAMYLQASETPVLENESYIYVIAMMQ